MKQLSARIKQSILLFIFSIIGMVTFAQETTPAATTTTTENTNTKTTSIFVEPWVWVVGGIVLLLIIIALFRRGNSNTKVERSTTVIR